MFISPLQSGTVKQRELLMEMLNSRLSMLTASRTTDNDLPASENQEGDFLLGWNINEAVELLGFVFRTFKTECDGESFQVDLTAEILHEHRGHLPEFGLGGVDADLIEDLLESTEGFC
jgi:hypothetical protein